MSAWVRVLRWLAWAAVVAMAGWAILDWKTFAAFVNEPNKLGSYFPGMFVAGSLVSVAALEQSEAKRRARESAADSDKAAQSTQQETKGSSKRRGQQQQQQQQQQFQQQRRQDPPEKSDTAELQSPGSELRHVDFSEGPSPDRAELEHRGELLSSDDMEPLEVLRFEAVGASSGATLPKIIQSSVDVVKEVLDAGAQSAPSDRVESTLYAPAVCRPGATIRVQAFFHTRGDREAAQAEALEFDPTTGRRARQWLSALVARGQEIDVALRAETSGFEIKSPERVVVWEGEPVSADFLVTVDQDVAPASAGFTAVVFIGGRPVGELAFTLSVEGKDEPLAALRDNRQADATARRFNNIFVSYSRIDLDQVRLVVRTLQLAEKEYFLDMEHLRSGQEWEEELFRRIDAADVFVLCWSKSASQSENVRKEVLRALAAEAARGKPRFVPFPLDGPPPTEPWAEIAHRHIGDNVYYRNAQAAQRRDRAN